jgi:hypothetical protein
MSNEFEDHTKNYADWNNRPKMDAAEFAKWQEEWYAREREECMQIRTETIRTMKRQLNNTDPIPELGTPIDIWFLKSCGISTENL